VDLRSLENTVRAATLARAAHLVYVSVAHPAPVMKAYIAARTECERIIRESGLRATIPRPWYILGPGHYWPYMFVPLYKMLETISSTRERAIRLGLVTREQFVKALIAAVEPVPEQLRIWETRQIREAGAIAAGKLP
jgi:uncharacterized protein YbjT (DUF2867 family)